MTTYDILDQSTLNYPVSAGITYDEFSVLPGLRFTKNGQAYVLEPVVSGADVILPDTRKWLCLYDVFTSVCYKRPLSPMCFGKEKTRATAKIREWIGGDSHNPIQINEQEIDTYIKDASKGYTLNSFIDGDGSKLSTDGSWYFLDWAFDYVKLYQLRHFKTSGMPDVELDCFELRREENEYVD